MRDIDDDLPARRRAAPPDLATWSVEELEDYVRRLEAEIERAKAAIDARQSVRGAAEALFKKAGQGSGADG
jgi:uncharacterized small protein (DUF1192 family)